MVEPHLLVAVRFSPTSRGQWHQEHRAPTQEPSIFFRYPFSTFSVGTQLILAVFTDVLGLRFLTHPAVTSASEVLTQTCRCSGVVLWPACWALNPRSKRAKLHEHVQNRTPEQNVDVPIPRVRWYLRGDPFDPTRAGIPASTLQERISERIVASIVVVSVPQIQEQIVASC